MEQRKKGRRKSKDSLHAYNDTKNIQILYTHDDSMESKTEKSENTWIV